MKSWSHVEIIKSLFHDAIKISWSHQEIVIAWWNHKIMVAWWNHKIMFSWSHHAFMISWFHHANPKITFASWNYGIVFHDANAKSWSSWNITISRNSVTNREISICITKWENCNLPGNRQKRENLTNHQKQWNHGQFRNPISIVKTRRMAQNENLHGGPKIAISCWYRGPVENVGLARANHRDRAFFLCAWVGLAGWGWRFEAMEAKWQPILESQPPTSNLSRRQWFEVGGPTTIAPSLPREPRARVFSTRARGSCARVPNNLSV